MIHYIKNIILYFVIFFFMYVILSREALIEGKKKKGLGLNKAVDKVVDKVADKVDAGTDFARQQTADAAAKARRQAEEAAEKVRRQAEEAAEKARRQAEEAAEKTKKLAEEAAAKAKKLAEEAAALAEKLLNEAFDKLISGLSRLASIFSSAKQNLSNLDNTSANFEKDIANSTSFANQVNADNVNAVKVNTVQDNSTKNSVSNKEPGIPFPTSGFGGGGISKRLQT